ncbi:hypothetical protein [Demequina pelophila]|uniref:hypothetical protein n=1 Tax=Demequina pelophila TaxID=1638984 RepID=UPI00157A3F14|nr:hypothetical protein [Demequina pelophila]
MTLTYSSGGVTAARVETQQRPAVLGLLASGRMAPSSGTVTIDGRPDRARLRRSVALVDAPAVCDPAPEVSTLGIVEEELMFAGRAAHPRAARRLLASLDLEQWARIPIGAVAPTDRCRLLLELAALRPGVEGVVLVSPDRHGGDPAGWWNAALALARRDLAVLALVGDAAMAAIARTPVGGAPDLFEASPEPAGQPTPEASEPSVACAPAEAEALA